MVDELFRIAGARRGFGRAVSGSRHECLPFDEQVDGEVDESVPSVAAGVVADLLAGQIGEQRGP
jgi:hypothetical protein